ncbi:MAG: fructose-6-phosphate aldolase [Candidatus Marinimicrobia bacterium]|jgi:transaldolase|nr:fructose-6-phosphate aldolase [Candidatus Neomarinimicrobiota bacterium]OQC44527.1 MAG: Transaldolase [Candidatus Marinimicrobia bacterium ADurb.Bin030]NLA22827.1 fructose-6-phosphate aldolase [Candidatus Neomarinimicrobiota bacterium]HNZ36696.1 fructose-6-phosphate aldolase [Candidatus Neomarinimicrobiota bacterium]HOD37327.1 fructose-6-phosphate aldolase [Candidatus Neomarinimicrobiota bacterium]
MKLFIDTANLEEIRKAQSWGLLDGVTTNPTLLSKEKGNFKEILLKICETVNGPVSGEVVSLDAEGMVREAEDLAALHKNMVIKVPITLEGLKAIKILSEKGIRTNTTLIFSPLQAILAAKAGATFISPFVGRLDDIHQVGMELVQQIKTIYDNYGIRTEIIVASIRNPLHIVEAALIGADICTIPFNVMEKMVKHPLTDKGITQFLEDWKKVEK